MMLNLLAVTGGIVILAVAAGWFVDCAAALAARARLTPAVIGLTIVAAGTSAPEFCVSLMAALRGSSDIALGNVVGSNIFNITFILGLAALITPIPVSRTVVRLETPFMLLVSWVCLLLCRDGWLDALEGAFFLVAMALFNLYSVRLARREASQDERDDLAHLVPRGAALIGRQPLPLILLGLAGGCAALALGSHILVRGAVGLAALLGMSERLIGLTIVAAGTSMPELVTSLVAAFKKQHDIAVANLIGSNVFNILFILGACSVIRPIAVAPPIAAADNWVMVATAALLLAVVATGRGVSRLEGAGLLCVYLGYAGWLIAG